MAAVPAQVEELEGNRVRLTVEVSPHDLEHAVEHAASDLAQSVKIPGFRKGKVPRQVLLSRVGKERLYAEAVDSHIGSWYSLAVARTRLRPVTRPEYDFQLPTADDQAWTFSATVEVQPLPEIVDWTTLEVPRVESEVPEELITSELDALRESVAELVPVTDRAAQAGDAVVVDLVSPSGESQSDTVVELGSGRLVEEVETALVGAKAGETKQVTYELADDTTATVDVTLKSISEKVLPELDDELARAASEFDTLDELRTDIEQRLREQIDEEIDAAFRSAAVDVLVTASSIEPAGPLVETRTRELLNGFVRSLARRAITPQAYFAATGASETALIAQLHGEAALSVARELALEALAERAGIVITDEDVKSLIREQAEEGGEDVENVIEEIWAHGQHEALREDLRLRAALDRLVADVKPISVAQAEAREKLWTPDKEKPATETKLWTPGSKELA
ncbi:MAG: trigger factor [Actinobacteria bacterium]|nr:MAG: trigger factor [Actinomycetota bacterium]